MKFNLYHKRFLNSFSSENVAAVFSRYKNAHKEITESWAMLEAARQHVYNINECKVIIVGDGCSPRTGVIFAYFTKADVVSVDPGFNMDHWYEHCKKQSGLGFPVKNIVLYNNKIEDLKIDCEGKPCVVIWPHSHANMNNTVIFNWLFRYDIAMPCCVPIPHNWMTIPHTVYIDPHVLSPKNEIHIWETKVECLTT